MAVRWHTQHSRFIPKPLSEFICEIVDDSILGQPFPVRADPDYELEFALTVAQEVKRRLESTAELARRRELWIRSGHDGQLAWLRASTGVNYIDVQLWEPVPWRWFPTPPVDAPGEYALHLYYSDRTAGTSVLARIGIKMLPERSAGVE